MPKKKVVRRARQARREGKAPSTQASEFVREKMHELGSKKGPKSRKQAIAIGLDEARRAGVPLPPPPGERSPQRGGSRQAANRDSPTNAPRSSTRARTARTGQKRTAQRKGTRTASAAQRAPSKGETKTSARGRATPAKPRPAKQRTANTARGGGARTASRPR